MLAVALAACSVPTRESVLSQWQGRHISEAITQLGPPQQKTEIHGETTVYTWEKEYGSDRAIMRSTCRTGLTVNEDGIIVDAAQVSESLLC